MHELGDPWDLLTAAEVASPTPGPGEVVVRVEATDLSFADILQCQGTYQVERAPPFTPGMNTVGTVLMTGEDNRVAVGDRTIGPALHGVGGFAEQALILADQAIAVPGDMDAHLAAAIHVPFGTAWLAYHDRDHLMPGETVLVLGAAGGVGSAAVQLASASDCWVIAAAGGQPKTEFCQRLGADIVIDYSEDDLYGSVMDLTDGRGVDVVFDPVGGELSAAARRTLTWEGRLLVIGFASGDVPSAPLNHALVKNYSIVGVHMGGYRSRAQHVLEAGFEQLGRLLADGRIEPPLERIVGFADLPGALRSLWGREVMGRWVFDPRC